ncbi:MAG: TylF/MycF/NovP-related O-methyltransferase [Acidimicrobiales bacterium]
MTARARQDTTDVADRYLELLKQCLSRYLFIDEQFGEYAPQGWKRPIWKPVSRCLARRHLVLARVGGDRGARETGRDWPPHAETMVGLRRLENLQRCLTDVVRRDVPGDVIETGVWRGGSSIFMRAVLAALGDTQRRVWVADSFEGLPAPDARRFPIDKGVDVSSPTLSVSLDDVRRNFEKYQLLDRQVEFLPGWFRDTLPAAPIEQLSLIRLDGDLYESTMDAISALYPKLSVGGYLIVDDYNWGVTCRQAISDYRAEHGITEEIETIDWTGAYWQRLE